MWLRLAPFCSSANYEVWQLSELESHLQILVYDFQVSVVPCSDMEAIDLTWPLKDRKRY